MTLDAQDSLCIKPLCVMLPILQQSVLQSVVHQLLTKDLKKESRPDKPPRIEIPFTKTKIG